MLKVKLAKTKMTDSAFHKHLVQKLPSKYFTFVGEHTNRQTGQTFIKYLFNNYFPIVLVINTVGRNDGGELFSVSVRYPNDDVLEGWEKFNGVYNKLFDVDAFVEYCKKSYSNT